MQSALRTVLSRCAISTGLFAMPVLDGLLDHALQLRVESIGYSKGAVDGTSVLSPSTPAPLQPLLPPSTERRCWTRTFISLSLITWASPGAARLPIKAGEVNRE